MKLGICIKGYWKDELFDVNLPDAWRHNGLQHVSGFTEDYFDFDEDHIIDYLIKHPYSWGTCLMPEICEKLKERIDPNDDYMNDMLEWHMRGFFKQKLIKVRKESNKEKSEFLNFLEYFIYY